MQCETAVTADKQQLSPTEFFHWTPDSSLVLRRCEWQLVYCINVAVALLYMWPCVAQAITSYSTNKYEPRLQIRPFVTSHPWYWHAYHVFCELYTPFPHIIVLHCRTSCKKANTAMQLQLHPPFLHHATHSFHARFCLWTKCFLVFCMCLLE